MKILSPLLFAVSANLDALLIGASYGLRRVRITLLQNLLISLITLLGSFLSIGLGRLLGPKFPTAWTAYVSSILLISMGCFHICHQNHPQKQNITRADPLSLPDLPDNQMLLPTVFEVITLGILLTLNNIGIGFSTGLAGICILPTMLLSLLLSMLFLPLGNRIGSASALRSLAAFADPLSGILLICLGILELFL